MAEETLNYGPPKVGFFQGFLKVLAGLFGGLTGTLLLTGVFLLSSSILNPVFNPVAEGTPNPLFIFIFMAMIFASALCANIVSTLFLTFTERERYVRVSSTIYQIFILNVIVFILTIPIYIITSTVSLPLTGFAAAIHVLIASFASALILEVMARPKYALLGIYSVTLGILLSLCLNFLIYNVAQNSLALLFLAIPITWASIAFAEAVFYSFYYSLFQNYGTDFLSIKTEYGSDVGAEEEAEEQVEEPEKKDVEGTEFLKENKTEETKTPEQPTQEPPKEQK